MSAIDTGEVQVSVRLMRDAAARLYRESERLEAAAAALERDVVGAGGLAIRGGRELLDAVDQVVEVGETLHYGDMVDRLLCTGVLPGGQDPAGTVLAQLGRCDRYVSARPRSGRYERVA